MNTFLQMSATRRLLAFQQVDAVMGLQALSVEKDLWVCWTLRELFRLPGVAPHLTFKGGTSLSKAWKLIHRFSEDVDLVVDKEVLGFGGDAAPDKAPSNSQLKARLEALMAASQRWVQQTLQPALSERITATLGASGWKLEVDPDMADGQCLLFHYPSIFPLGSAGYVRPVVKIELGARSDHWPSETKTLVPYVLEQFPALDSEGAVEARVLAVERTFWEKACLLHEETFRPPDKPRKTRMVRHYYDLWCLLQAGMGEKAIRNRELFQRVAEHRSIFFRHSWVDYTTHKPGTFRLRPPEEHLPGWRADYQQMLGPMFFGETPTFEEMIATVSTFEELLNSIKWTA